MTAINRRTKTPAYNSTYLKGGFSFSKVSFVVNQTLVLRINVFGDSRQLLVAANH
nr:hypothetical protein [Bacteroidota bacterium]